MLRAQGREKSLAFTGLYPSKSALFQSLLITSIDYDTASSPLFFLELSQIYVSVSVTLDAVVKAFSESEFELDHLLALRYTSTHGLDSLVMEINTITLEADAGVKATSLQTHQADAALVETMVVTSTLDAYTVRLIRHSLEDAISTAESISFLFSKQLADSLALEEEVEIKRILSLSDSTSLTEALGAKDILGLLDRIRRDTRKWKSLTDTITLTDAEITAAYRLGATLSDSITLSEAVLLFKTFKTMNDVVRIEDNIEFYKEIQLVIEDFIE